MSDSEAVNLRDEEEKVEKKKNDLNCTSGLGKRFVDLVKSSRIRIYSAHALSSWGDRLWQFAAGLFLYDMDRSSFLLTALGSLLAELSVLLFGSLVGRAIDNTNRLKSIKCALFVQNFSVAICGICVATLLGHVNSDESILENGNLTMSTTTTGETEVKSIFQLSKFSRGVVGLFLFFLIVFNCIARLASVGQKIIVNQDWLVVISNGDESLLTRMNAVMRRIDLSMNILAPILFGTILTFRSHPIISPLFVVAWNLLSVGIEYLLLKQLYNRIPALRNKLDDNANELGVIEKPPSEPPKPDEEEDNLIISKHSSMKETILIPSDSLQPYDIPPPIYPRKKTVLKRIRTESKEDVIEPMLDGVKEEDEGNCCTKFFKDVFNNWLDGWKCYFTSEVVFAGISLSVMYLTVLGFDSMTVVYARSCGFSEFIISMFMAVSALFGVMGTIAYPRFVKCIGVNFSGLIGSTFQMIILGTFCITSLFLPDSPYILYKHRKESVVENWDKSSLLKDRWVHPHLNIISVTLFCSGVAISRFGLWTIDLAINQLLQIRILPEIRGTVNGVQHSLNTAFNLIRFILVLILPKPKSFGHLVIISVLCLGIAYIFYLIQLVKDVVLEKKNAQLSKDIEAEKERERNLSEKEPETNLSEKEPEKKLWEREGEADLLQKELEERLAIIDKK
ncbi:hypothetical protein SNEBB_005677 [Seison nebaliae]|nr:hypothetical protein SNEBB_005677 [Seison nebaliae]